LLTAFPLPIISICNQVRLWLWRCDLFVSRSIGQWIKAGWQVTAGSASSVPDVYLGELFVIDNERCNITCSGRLASCVLERGHSLLVLGDDRWFAKSRSMPYVADAVLHAFANCYVVAITQLNRMARRPKPLSNAFERQSHSHVPQQHCAASHMIRICLQALPGWV